MFWMRMFTKALSFVKSHTCEQLIVCLCSRQMRLKWPFVEDVVSDMPCDKRFRKFADSVVKNYMDTGWDFPSNLWAESPDLNPATNNGCESYHAHLNADFYSAQPNNYLFVQMLLRQQTSTYISLASLSQSRPVRKNSREKSAFLRRMYTDYHAGHVSRK